MPDAQSPGRDPVAALMEPWVAAVGHILESMTDVRPEVTWRTAEAPAPGQFEQALWWEQRFRTESNPAVWIGAEEDAWSQLGGRTLLAAGLETVEPGDARNTWLEILSQSTSVLAREATDLLARGEITCDKGEESPPLPGVTAWAEAQIAYADATPVFVLVAFDPVWNEVFNPQERKDPPQPPTATPRVAAEPAAPVPKALDLLLDVELPLSISFGRAQLPLKDVLKLTTGSIVELNRTINEPVEVVVNNRVIARGEVVVVDGNYGVRIHEILSRQERMRSVR